MVYSLFVFKELMFGERLCLHVFSMQQCHYIQLFKFMGLKNLHLFAFQKHYLPFICFNHLV